MRSPQFFRFASGLVFYNVLVVLWGAYVRASKSGDGCGSHWPLCNGEVVPLAAQQKTMIEFFHRGTSGIALILVIALVIWAFRAFPKKHAVRRGAATALFFTLTEAFIGAGLVIFGLVAYDTSAARAYVLGAHLINTFILLGALAYTAWASSVEKPKLQFTGQGALAGLIAIGLVGTLLVGVTGVVAALGDTLYPSKTLAEGFAADFNPASHFLIRLRSAHPIAAIGVGVYLVLLARTLANWRGTDQVKLFARVVAAIFCVQIGLGFVNVLLLAPIWMQIVHLFVADIIWIALVLMSLSALSVAAPAAVKEKREVSALSPIKSLSPQ